MLLIIHRLFLWQGDAGEPGEGGEQGEGVINLIFARQFNFI